MKELKFISFVIVKIKSLHQFDTEIMNADVNVKINVEVINKKISVCFFVVFAN